MRSLVGEWEEIRAVSQCPFFLPLDIANVVVSWYAIGEIRDYFSHSHMAYYF